MMKKNYSFLNSGLKKISLVLATTMLLGHEAHCQQTYTFTNCAATGSLGITQVATAYVSTNLNGNASVTPTGIQTWTVPLSGVYRVTALGASSGKNGDTARTRLV